MFRRHSARLLKTAAILFSVAFLSLQFYITHVSPRTSSLSTSSGASDNTSSSDGRHRQGSEGVEDGTDRRLEDSESDGISRRIISNKVEEYNTYQMVRNTATFGEVGPETVVVVVQVHTRLEYLHRLIDSLKAASNIDKALVIFSHDVFDTNINAVVQGITFCRVMQVFYPFSIQTHPHTFPGESPGDCPRDFKKAQALEKGCSNAEHPDSYGHYREAKFTQTKHHWWWKAHRVFDQLKVMEGHQGWVVLLEEDHYVTPDFLFMVDKLSVAARSHCSDCNIFSLGTYLKQYNYPGDNTRAEETQWVSSKHNMGMVLRAETWRAIKACASQFCTYDDYNWDWSLQFVGQTCMKPPLKVLLLKAPRVFHIGECGVHHKKKDCANGTAYRNILKVVADAKPSFFPADPLSVIRAVKKRMKVPKGNGGWGDLRDHHFCLNISQHSVPNLTDPA